MVLVLWWSSLTVAVVHGRALGDVTAVVLADPKRGSVRGGVLLGEGRYEVAVPRAMLEPAVVLHGKDGALVQSSRLVIVGERVEAPILALWTSGVRIRRDEDTIRFDWSPIPAGPGFPERRRYSVLLTYWRTTGEPSETSLLTADEAVAEITLHGLSELMPEHDPARRDVTVSVRAFDPHDPEGPLWRAVEVPWELPASEAEGSGTPPR